MYNLVSNNVPPICIIYAPVASMNIIDFDLGNLNLALHQNGQLEARKAHNDSSHMQEV